MKELLIRAAAYVFCGLLCVGIAWSLAGVNDPITLGKVGVGGAVIICIIDIVL